MNDDGYIRINLENLLKEREMSQTQFLKLTNLQQKNYKKWTNQSIASLDVNVLARICNVLECTIAELLEYVPPQK